MYQPIEKLKIGARQSVSISSRSSSLMSIRSQYSSGDQMSMISSTDSSSMEMARRDQGFPEELFPVDTVKQIYNDIEKLFSEGDESAQTATGSDKSHLNQCSIRRPMLKVSTDYQSKYESCRIHFALNETMSVNQKNLSTMQYIQLCSFELNRLDDQLGKCETPEARPAYSYNLFGDCIRFPKGTHAGTKVCYPFVATRPLIIYPHGNDTASVAPFTLNDLHSLIWNLFELYDKLIEFVRLHTAPSNTSRPSDSGKLLATISETIEHWYSIGEAIKDRIIIANTFIELQATMLAAIKTQHLEQLWKLTRQLQTLIWLQCSSEMASPYGGPRMPDGGFGGAAPAVFLA